MFELSASVSVIFYRLLHRPARSLESLHHIECGLRTPDTVRKDVPFRRDLQAWRAVDPGHIGGTQSPPGLSLPVACVQPDNLDRKALAGLQKHSISGFIPTKNRITLQDAG